jgi:hypothetical protein
MIDAPYSSTVAKVDLVPDSEAKWFARYESTGIFLEGLNGLVLKFGYKGDKTRVSSGKLNTISMIFIMGSTWITLSRRPRYFANDGALRMAYIGSRHSSEAIIGAPIASIRSRMFGLNIVYKLF